MKALEFPFSTDLRIILLGISYSVEKAEKSPFSGLIFGDRASGLQANWYL
jgi:hypothetical protein